jgi:cytochrome c oxidase subunit 1
MILAAICGSLLLLAFLAFFYNIVMTVGIKGVIGIFSPAKNKTTDLIAAEK